MIIPKPECYLGPDILNKTWVMYANMSGYADSIFPKNYLTVSRSSITSRRFEEWLWKQGATVRRINHRYHLEFVDAQDALSFKLKWL